MGPQDFDAREREIKDLDRKLDEMDALAQEGHDKLEDALKAAETKENEVINLGEEVVGLTDDLQKVSKRRVCDMPDEDLPYRLRAKAWKADRGPRVGT